MKLKVVAITIIVLVVLAAVVLWTTRRGGEENAAKVREIAEAQARNASTPDEASSGNSTQQGNEPVSAGVSEDASDETGETDAYEESGVSERTPEQQRRYEVLAKYLPRYFELSKLIKEIEDQCPSADDAPKGLSQPERIYWYQQKVKPWKEKYGEQLRTLRMEKKTMQTALEENFPEAAGTVNLGDGYSRFSINLTKLRELVGGSLPTDKG